MHGTHPCSLQVLCFFSYTSYSCFFQGHFLWFYRWPVCRFFHIACNLWVTRNIIRKKVQVKKIVYHHWVATGEQRLANDNLQNRKSTIKPVISEIFRWLLATWEFLSMAEGWDSFLAVWVYAGGRRWVPIGVTHSISWDDPDTEVLPTWS